MLDCYKCITLFLKKTMFFTTFSIHVDYIFSLYDFAFCREKRDSFQVRPGSKSLKNTLDGVNFNTKTLDSLADTF